MHSAAKFFLSVLSLLVLLLLSFAQLLCFMYVLNSEGPHVIFLLWFLSAVVLTYIGNCLPKKLKTVRIFSGIMAVLITAAGLFAILVQVQVTRRSFAEAWLESARSGGAFGFFSFFASEIYAVFIFVQVFFFSKRKFITYFFSIAAAGCLCYGMVFHNNVLLGLVIFFALCMYVFYTRFSLSGLRDRVLRMLFPLTAAAVLSSIIAFFVWISADPSLPSFPLDLRPLVQRLAPQFPLLTSIPGYGFTAEAQNMPRSTYLTTRALFEVNGQPDSIHYFMTGRFQNWQGNSWSKDTSGAADVIPVSYFGESQSVSPYSAAETVVLTLLEDFYTVFPVKANTVEIRIPKTLDFTFTADESDALRFNQIVKRGLQVMLVQSNDKYAYSEEEAEQRFRQARDLYTAIYAGSASWDNLVKTLLEQARLRAALTSPQSSKDTSLEQRSYLEVLLEFFSKDFIYSLSTDAPVSVQNPIEHFVFESKKGFCIYYASAFVLLARSAGIPARLAEGFRIQLDETGRGRITGSSSHAWSEVWIDGRWRIFEPTPPFMSSDPFSYVTEHDRTARVQLEQVFDVKQTKIEPESHLSADLVIFIRGHIRVILIISISVTLCMLALLFFVPLLRSPSQNCIKKARRLVKKYAKKGVLPPQKTGWLLWKKEVEALHEEDAGTADEMIRIAYSGD